MTLPNHRNSVVNSLKIVLNRLSPSGVIIMNVQFLTIFRLLLLGLCIFSSIDSFSEERQSMGLTLTSANFPPMGDIPEEFTCDGNNSSPALSWSNVPANAKSLVLIVDDPDAPDPNHPKMTWVHWILYNIPPTITELAQAIPASNLPGWTQQGINDWKRTGYGGPCPPIGKHRYFHKLYALDVELSNLHQPNKAQLEAAMAQHIIEKTELIGLYQKK